MQASQTTSEHCVRWSGSRSAAAKLVPSWTHLLICCTRGRWKGFEPSCSQLFTCFLGLPHSDCLSIWSILWQHLQNTNSSLPVFGWLVGLVCWVCLFVFHFGLVCFLLFLLDDSQATLLEEMSSLLPRNIWHFSWSKFKIHWVMISMAQHTKNTGSHGP